MPNPTTSKAIIALIMLSALANSLGKSVSSLSASGDSVKKVHRRSSCGTSATDDTTAHERMRLGCVRSYAERRLRASGKVVLPVVNLGRSPISAEGSAQRQH